MADQNSPMLPDQFDHPLELAGVSHRDRRRKISGIQDISCRRTVAALLPDHGGDAGQAVPPCPATGSRTGAGWRRYGRSKAVTATASPDVCSPVPTPPGRATPRKLRKDGLIAGRAPVSPDALLGTGCDTHHLNGSILAGVNVFRLAVFDRVTPQRAGIAVFWFRRRRIPAPRPLPRSARLHATGRAIAAQACPCRHQCRERQREPGHGAAVHSDRC